MSKEAPRQSKACLSTVATMWQHFFRDHQMMALLELQLVNRDQQQWMVQGAFETCCVLEEWALWSVLLRCPKSTWSSPSLGLHKSATSVQPSLDLMVSLSGWPGQLQPWKEARILLVEVSDFTLWEYWYQSALPYNVMQLIKQNCSYKGIFLCLQKKLRDNFTLNKKCHFLKFMVKTEKTALKRD